MPWEHTKYSYIPETSTEGEGRKKTTGHRKEREWKAASARRLLSPSLPFSHPCDRWERSLLSWECTFKRDPQLRTALCQLKNFHQNTAICTFEGKDAGQGSALQVKGAFTVSITIVITRVITASYRDGISPSVIKHRPQ